MAHFAVTYRYADDPDALDRVRPEHRAFLRGLHEQGDLLASGPVGDQPGEQAPIDALLVMQAADQSAIAALLDQDPFVAAGLVRQRVIAPWNPVIGVFAG